MGFLGLKPALGNDPRVKRIPNNPRGSYSLDPTALPKGEQPISVRQAAINRGIVPAVEVVDSQEGPNAPLERSDPLQFLKYPLNLGVDPIYKHLMRINIYQQAKTNFKNTGTLDRNAFDNQRAGASKITNLNDAAVGIGVATTADIVKNVAGQAVTKAGAAAFAVANTTDIDISRKTVRQPVAYISLYMPETVQFTDKHDFDPVSVTEALGAAGTAANIFEGAGEATAVTAQATGTVGSSFKDVVLFSNGYALNPQLEILYKGSKNRQFVYSFRFTPRSEEEAAAVIAIIKTLRFHASPEYEIQKDASRYFIPPSEFDIEFYIGSEKNKNLPRIAQCVLENVDVNYAAGGQYSTFNDGTPVEISMQLTFTETIILTKEDIDSGF